jgi:hypothetical protein
MLLEEGVPGLRTLLEETGVPPLTFDQETQVQSVYEAHDRERRRLIAESGETVDVLKDAAMVELQEQLLLAAVKFLNPAQRNTLTNTIDSGLNTDLPEDEAELREYLGDLRSPGGGGLSIDGFRGGRMPKREEIQEIRINENSFTAEQSRQGRGQTQIITRGVPLRSTATSVSISPTSRSMPATRSHRLVRPANNEISAATWAEP